MKRIAIVILAVVLLFAVAMPAQIKATSKSGSVEQVAALPPPAGVLSVTPLDGLTATGTVGGPFDSASIVYTLQNTGGEPINWTAVKTQSWLTLALENVGILPMIGGKLSPGATARVICSINDKARPLAANTYTDTVNFTNTTNGSGNTTRPASLTIISYGLSVTPLDGLTATGVAGGPFDSASIDYTLQNTHSAPIKWTASKTQSWITLSAESGTLAPAASVTVTVSINSSANSLLSGTYTDKVIFKNITNGYGTNPGRPVSLTIR